MLVGDQREDAIPGHRICYFIYNYFLLFSCIIDDRIDHFLFPVEKPLPF